MSAPADDTARRCATPSDTARHRSTPLVRELGAALVPSDAVRCRHPRLVDNNLGPKGGAALAEGLKGNSTLQSLGLEDTGLGPKGGAALAEGLKGNSVLTSLSLRLNNLTDEAKQAVKDAAGSGVQIQF